MSLKNLFKEKTIFGLKETAYSRHGSGAGLPACVRAKMAVTPLLCFSGLWGMRALACGETVSRRFALQR